MTEEITRFVEKTVETNENLIQLVEQKLSDHLCYKKIPLREKSKK